MPRNIGSASERRWHETTPLNALRHQSGEWRICTLLHAAESWTTISSSGQRR